MRGGGEGGAHPQEAGTAHNALAHGGEVRQREVLLEELGARAHGALEGVVEEAGVAREHAADATPRDGEVLEEVGELGDEGARGHGVLRLVAAGEVSQHAAGVHAEGGEEAGALVDDGAPRGEARLAREHVERVAVEAARA